VIGIAGKNVKKMKSLLRKEDVKNVDDKAHQILV
jgi:hypothetical protein